MDSQDYELETPLSWAAKNGHEAVVKLLQSIMPLC
jgi:ankyrin repeat protein